MVGAIYRLMEGDATWQRQAVFSIGEMIRDSFVRERRGPHHFPNY